MAELDGIPQETRDRIEQIGAADIVLSLPGCSSQEVVDACLRRTEDAMRPFSRFSAVLAHCYEESEPANGSSLRLLRLPPPGADPLGINGGLGAYRILLAASRLLQAKACGVLGSDPESIRPESIRRIIEPVIEKKQDLAVARYPRRRFEGLINSGIVYPLLRALYGKRVPWPMARDFGLSERLIDRTLAPVGATGQDGSPAWMVTKAVSAGFDICQVYLDTRAQSASAPADPSSALTQVLGPIFLEMEQNAAFWQKVRATQPTVIFGDPISEVEEPAAVDVTRMIESFQLGFRSLPEVWNLVLSPATVIGLKKLTILPADRFRMPDDLWVHTVYDFALASRQRVMNRDHLLRALTPLYLGWVASFAREIQSARPEAVEERIEKLCAAYEAQKPYLQSRWRWPDRFNP
ncbi:MAG TPA: hypothetical protein VL285_00360 [Bryobacteraceae bacterium]|jgi:hypothetical protein|nr:hypothetical protein [Bryobacteraceae bacterium]